MSSGRVSIQEHGKARVGSKYKFNRAMGYLGVYGAINQIQACNIGRMAGSMDVTEAVFARVMQLFKEIF